MFIEISIKRKKVDILTALISLLSVRSKMAVCVLSRKSLYPLTLQPADHFRTQNRLGKVYTHHTGSKQHGSKINLKMLPVSCGMKVSLCPQKSYFFLNKSDHVTNNSSLLTYKALGKWIAKCKLHPLESIFKSMLLQYSKQ